jgi:hypothetical protein
VQKFSTVCVFSPLRVSIALAFEGDRLVLKVSGVVDVKYVDIKHSVNPKNVRR